MTPAWYLGFPVSIPLSVVIPFVLVAAPLRFGGHTQLSPDAVFLIALFTAAVYALLPPALILGGLALAGSAISRTLTLPGAASKAAAQATVARDVPAVTGRSGRGTAIPPRQPAKTVPSRTAAADAQKGHGDSPTASSKTSTKHGGAKRAVGGSGRNR
ncbi:MAG: hypothetical protein HY239_12065 [Mycolicibacterium aromaticivorans]|nr:hypothetical protein [Mycolicibacterium aromaticivorans]